MAGDGSQSPSSSSRSSDVLMTRSGRLSSKYWNGLTQKASSPGARTLTWPATALSHPSRARMRRDMAMSKRIWSPVMMGPPRGPCGGVAIGGMVGSSAESVQALGVPGQDQVPLGRGHAGEVGQDRRPGVGPVAGQVREVARPHDPLHPDVVAVADSVVVGDVREVHVALNVG